MRYTKNMDNPFFSSLSTQPLLFTFDESTEQLELFPFVWKLAEDLTSPDCEVRRQSVEQLSALNAPRFSPLIAYLLFTRLTDPDLSTRLKVIQALGNVFRPDREGRVAPSQVIHHLSYHLSQMRVRQIYALLEATLEDPMLTSHVESLINRCPYAGNHLTDILLDRKMPYAIREQAANIIGQLGFIDVIATLEKLVVRIESRLQGQSSMPFAPPQSLDEVRLLPAVRKALHNLQNP